MRRVNDLKHPISLVLGTLLFVVIAGLGVLSFQRQVALFQQIGFTAEPVLGTWQVRETNRATGLKTGDEILLVGGVQASSLNHLESLLRAKPSTEILLKRGAEVLPIAYQLPPLEIRWTYLLLAAIGLLYLIIGLYTAFKDRQGATTIFLFWCLSIAALFLLSPVTPTRDALDRGIYIGDQVARTMLPALTLHLFLVFPTALLRASWLRLAIPFVYLPSLFLAAFHLDQMLFGGRLLFGAADEAMFLQADHLEMMLIIGGHLLAAASLVVRLGRGAAWWEQKRQTQSILFGLLAGYIPFLVLHHLPSALGWQWPEWTTLFGVGALVFVPLAFAYAILKYKLWDMEIILRDSISYSLTALIGLFGFSLINQLIQQQLSDDQQWMRNLLAFGTGLTIASVMIPARHTIADQLERWQYRGTLGSRQALREMGQELLLERDLDKLCHALTTGLAGGLRIQKANLYLNQRAAMVPVRLGDGLPPALGELALGEAFWDRDVEGLSGVHLPGAAPNAGQQLFAAGYRYALPLTVRGQRIGVALLGYKEGERPLNSEDLSLARNLLNQAALAIENAQLVEEIRHQLQEVSALEDHNRGIIESSPAGIAVLDASGRITSANHAFAAITGVERPDLTGQLVEELIPIRPLPEPGSGLLDVSFCQLDGTERYLQVSRAVYEGKNDSELSVLVVQDTTEKTALELALKEKEQLASLGMLAAGVAHEVNTPITGISSYAQFLLADTAEDDPNHAVLKKIERQTFRASQIVRNLLEFARHRRQEFGPVSLNAVLEECAQFLIEPASEGQVTFAGLPLDDLPRVEGSETELHQVFTNLMVNAIDAMAKNTGGGCLSFASEVDEQRVRIHVSDTGPGIPPERLQRIFQPFFSSKLDKGGTGLGLALTYNIVRRHGGEIWAANHEDGPGCTFTVTLRRHLPAETR